VLWDKVNKNNIVFMTTLCSKRSRTPYSEWMRSNGLDSRRIRITNEILELQLFSKLCNPYSEN
jgi:hypothetical protein